jgi:hypothetical protein
VNADSISHYVAGHQPQSEPDTDLLRLQGWSVISSDGLYCSAWKGSQEILVVWQDGHWQKLCGNSGLPK